MADKVKDAVKTAAQTTGKVAETTWAEIKSFFRIFIHNGIQGQLDKITENHRAELAAFVLTLSVELQNKFFDLSRWATAEFEENRLTNLLARLYLGIVGTDPTKRTKEANAAAEKAFEKVLSLSKENLLQLLETLNHDPIHQWFGKLSNGADEEILETAAKINNAIKPVADSLKKWAADKKRRIRK